MYEITCRICARTFGAMHSKQCYCSEHCRLEGQRERIRDNQRRYRAQARVKNPMPTRSRRACESCGSEFVSKMSTHKFCSDICKTDAQHARARSKYHTGDVHLKNCSSCGSTTETPTWKPGIGVCDHCRVDNRSRDMMRAKERRRRLRKYGLTEESYDALLQSQGNRCAVCRSTEPGWVKDWAIDHDHDTRAVRGLLCNSCNAGIGQLGDDPERLRAAAAYLESHLRSLLEVVA